VLGDAKAALDLITSMPISNGKVGVIGTCSGCRHSLLVGTKAPGFSAVADLWGANVVVPPERPAEEKGASVWFPLSQVNIGYDHASYMRQEHVLLLDFVNPGINPGARVAVELDLESGKALVAELQKAIEAAEASGL
jgi:Dienelactone hydrolase family